VTLAEGVDRSLPYDADAEKRVLAALLIDRDAVYKIADRISADDFHVGRHGRIFAAIRSLLDRQEQIDQLTVAAELGRQDFLKEIGGPNYLAELVSALPTAFGIDQDTEVVANASLLRRIAKTAEQIATDAYNEPINTAEILDRSEQRLFELRERSRKSRLRHIHHALVAHYEKLTERMEHPTQLSGLASGFRGIDALTEGFSPGDLVIVAARPSVGKTSLSLGIAYEVACRGTPVVVFSLEKDALQIVARLLGFTGTSDLLALRTGHLLDTSAADALRPLPLYLDDTPGLSVMELRTKARRISAREKVGLIVVDYLQLMRTDEQQENRVQEIATITRSLKALARELDTVVIALSQLSRAAGDFAEPRLSTLRESGAIEQDADVVVMLWRDKDAPVARAPLLVHGSVAKNRNGPTGPFDLFFEGERARFFNPADNEGIPI